MRYVCTVCNILKDSNEVKKYVYANSTKTVKFLVCSDCHLAKLEEMKVESSKYLGKRFVLGVLRTPPKSMTE